MNENGLYENNPFEDMTNAALTCVAEMLAAMRKLEASIKKSRNEFEADLVANWNVDQCRSYNKLLYETATQRKERLQELLRWLLR